MCPKSYPTKKAADFLGVFHKSETVYHWMLQHGKARLEVVTYSVTGDFQLLLCLISKMHYPIGLASPKEYQVES
ncbi:hypothetical protein AWC38_SpisGene967 [Stylophora pistillata]|uniref:Uncharacterized protein n=1 Tax=Stylophora pistillata TaxID=50429 RepID=A0A2B4SW91_STYPI|nr:hypothetical protein AWC38_SpisGene967 [Stylophora pistillata]